MSQETEDVLKNSLSQLIETEKQGVDTLNMLHAQKSKIQTIRENTATITKELSLSSKILTKLKRIFM